MCSFLKPIPFIHRVRSGRRSRSKDLKACFNQFSLQTKMERSFDETFDSSEVKSWMSGNKFSVETIDRIADDQLDGEDVVSLYRDEKECRFYFPNFKERSKFKRLVGAVVEERDDIQITRSIPTISEDVRVSEKSAASESPKAAGDEAASASSPDGDGRCDAEKVATRKETPKGKLKGELCRIFEDDDIPTNIRSKYQKTWGPKILKYAEKKKELCKYVESMKTALLNEEETINGKTGVIDQTVLIVLNKVLRQKGRGCQQEVFTMFSRTAAIDDELCGFVQPQIVAVGDNFCIGQLYIVCVGQIICCIPQQIIVDSIVALLSSFYIYNIVYKDSKGILSFLEQSLLGIGRGHKLLAVNTFFNDIADL